MKRVLPAITGRGYDDLDISDSEITSMTYLAVNYGENSGEEEIRHLTTLKSTVGEILRG